MDIGERIGPSGKLFAIIAALAAGSACSTALPRGEGEVAPPSSTETMTLERILKQPLAQGDVGLYQVTADLFREARYTKSPGTMTGDIVTGGRLALADGYRLRAVVDYTKAGVLSIAVDEMPCFPLDRVAAITGARPVAAVSYPYSEGPNYDTRSARNKGVEVNLGRFAAGEKCLTEIRLIDVEKARKFVQDNDIVLPARNLDPAAGH